VEQAATTGCLPEIEAQKKGIAGRLTDLAGTMLERDHLIATYVGLIAENHSGRRQAIRAGGTFMSSAEGR
jgi:hypothetical protein